MRTAAQDLWPTEIGEYPHVSPVSILKQQASRLGSRTRNRVYARVESVAAGDEFVHQFIIVANALNYESPLFTVTHGIDFYPLQMDVDGCGGVLPTAASEQEFIGVLEDLFHSERTTRRINSLLAQLEG
jgi:hypothetical protein